MRIKTSLQSAPLLELQIPAFRVRSNVKGGDELLVDEVTRVKPPPAPEEEAEVEPPKKKQKGGKGRGGKGRRGK